MTTPADPHHRFRRLFDTMSNAVSVYEIVDGGRDFIVQDINPAAERGEGVRRSAVIGRRLSGILPTVRHSGLLAVLERVAQSGNAEHFPLTLHSDDGVSGWPAHFVAKLSDTEVVTIGEDATSGEPERLHKAFLNALVDNVANLVVVFDPSGEVLRFNRACRHLTGYSDTEIVGSKRFWDLLLPGDERERVDGVFRSLVGGISPIHHESHLLTKSVGQRLVAWESTIIRDGDGHVQFVIGSGQDVTDQRWVQARLEASEQQFRDLFRLSPDPCWIIEGERFVDCNDAAVRMLGYPDKRRLLNAHPASLSPPRQPDGEESATKAGLMIATAQEVGLHRFEWVHSRADGSAFDAEVTLSRIEIGGRDLLHCVWRDITERKRAENSLRHAGVVFTNSSEGIVVTDAANVIVSVNPAFTEITGFSAEEAIGKKPSILRSDRHDDRFYRDMWTSLVETGRWQGEIWNRRKDGSAYVQWQTITAVRGDDGVVSSFVSVFSDITELRHNEERVRYLAYHDALTGLPNRVLMQDRLQHGLGIAAREGHRLALFFLDLDNFKQVNDTMGHEVGDQLLQEVAEKITASVRKTDTVARLGGDEFVVVLEPAGQDEDMARIAEKICQVLDIQVERASERIHVTSSIGIAVYPDTGADAVTLLKQADTAMYAAKEGGRNTYRFFSGAMTEKTLTRLRIERDLREALEAGGRGLELHYQPKVCFHMNAPCGFEALIRWRRKGELLAPADFIPVAEESGLICALGDWVIHAVGRQLAQWKQDDLSHGPVSINVSPQQLTTGDFVGTVTACIKRFGIDAQNLQIEITENTLMADPSLAGKLLGQLRDIGVSIAIDDFGTGYSSLAYLTKLPIDVVKIDRSFVLGLSEGAENFEIVNSIVALAEALGMSVVAEGVETDMDVETLRRAKCPIGQGYLFARPMPACDVASWLSSRGQCLNCDTRHDCPDGHFVDELKRLNDGESEGDPAP